MRVTEVMPVKVARRQAMITHHVRAIAALAFHVIDQQRDGLCEFAWLVGHHEIRWARVMPVVPPK